MQEQIDRLVRGNGNERAAAVGAIDELQMLDIKWQKGKDLLRGGGNIGFE